MNFKEAFADDLQNVYFDLDEFASFHTIDGVECMVVLSEVKSEAINTDDVMQNTFNKKERAVNKVKYAIYARDTDLRRKITVNSMISLDGKRCFVHDVSHTDGIYTIIISINAV